MDTARVETEHNAHGLDQLGLGEARQADQQRVSAAEHSDERLLDHPFLPEDHVADCSLGGGDLGACRLRLTHDHVVEFFNRFSGGYRHLFAPVVPACWLFLLLNLLLVELFFVLACCSAIAALSRLPVWLFVARPARCAVQAGQKGCNIRATARKRVAAVPHSFHQLPVD